MGLVFAVLGVVIAIIVIILIASGSSKSKVSDEDMAVIREVIQYVDSVKKLYSSDDPTLHKAIGQMMLLPVDESDNCYKPNSCRVKITLLIYEDKEWVMQDIDRISEETDSNFTVYFNRETDNGQPCFVARTAGRFTSSYKPFMSSLYKEIENTYSAKFSFDEARIMLSEIKF